MTRQDRPAALHLEPRYLVDGMLGSLARKLRILGFDTVYDKGSSDSELISSARHSGRTLVTSDFELFLRGTRGCLATILVKETNDRDRLVTVLGKSRVTVLPLIPNSRCSVCNGVLRSETADNSKCTMICSICGKTYWRGSHWKKLNELIREVRQSLSGRLAG